MTLGKVVIDIPKTDQDAEPVKSLDAWASEFGQAEAAAKPRIATQWLEQSIRPINNKGYCSSYTNRILENRSCIRDMVWSFPDTESIRAETRQWLAICLFRTLPIFAEGLPVLHDLWLAQNIDDRIAALWALDARPELMDDMGSIGEPWLRAALWDVAREDGMRGTVVFSATRLTLGLYVSFYSPEQRMPHQELINVIGVFLARCETTNDAFLESMDYADMRRQIAEVPAASLCCLIHVEECKGLNNQTVHGVSRPTMEQKFSSLVTWLPGQKEAIDAARAVGFSYVETLYQLRPVLSPQESAKLPADITMDYS